MRQIGKYTHDFSAICAKIAVTVQRKTDVNASLKTCSHGPHTRLRVVYEKHRQDQTDKRIRGNSLSYINAFKSIFCKGREEGGRA
jgi:hypothetical protein